MGREITALLDFMYRGEVRVAQHEIKGLMNAAESLQVRGLAASEQRVASPQPQILEDTRAERTSFGGQQRILSTTCHRFLQHSQ